MPNNGLSSNAQPSAGDGASGSRRRKIDRSEWPKLLARRRAGATQAQIAQDYGVSQGTVSQILKRARAEAEGEVAADEAADSTAAETGIGPAPAAPTAQETTAPQAPAPRRTLTTRSSRSGGAADQRPRSLVAAPQPDEGEARPADAPASAPAHPGGAAQSAPATAGPSAPAAQGGEDGQPATAAARDQNPLADRLRQAAQHCAELVDQSATTENLAAAVHEVRRALAAIEIDAAKQSSAATAPRPRPAAQEPAAPAAPDSGRQAAPTRLDPPKNAGRVKFFKPEKGFGFIIPDEGGDDIFVGKDTVQAAGIDRLSEGERVRYTPGPGAKGLEAKTIERIN